MKIRTIPMLVCLVVLGAICLAGQPMGVAPTPLSAPESLQVVIDRGGPLVYVPKGHYTLEATLRLRSDLVLHFESRTVIEAAAGAMKGMEDCLIAAHGVQNVSIYAHGATFRMRKTDYRDEKIYKRSEFRHVLGLFGCKNVAVYGGLYEKSGGDGIYVGPLVGPPRIPCERILIRGVACDDNLRQGISVVAARGVRGDAAGVGGYYGVTIEDSVLTRTAGTSPQAGIDVEPEPPDPADVLIRRCRSEGNRGPAYMWSLQHMKRDSYPPRIVMEDCTYAGVPIDQPTLRMTGIFSATPPTGYLEDRLPAGTLLQWNDLIWKK